MYHRKARLAAQDLTMSTLHHINSLSDSQSQYLPHRMTFASEIDLLHRTDAPSPYARESDEDLDEDCDRRWVEDWCRHANVVALLSTLLFITVATFFSHYYVTSQANPHEILAFYHVRVRKFLGGSSGGITTTNTIALAPTSFSKPLVTCAAVLTCAVLSALLRQWILRYVLVDRSRYGFRSPGVLRAFIMQHGSLRNVERSSGSCGCVSSLPHGRGFLRAALSHQFK
ncbi:hypothetical protein EI94DRAFT_1700237 [Lactarius quietus]|nr:hypothetical protein EI94DRAFT_1700237 [Lactarius quietus]